MIFSNDRVLRMYNLPIPENSRFGRFACSQIRTIIPFFQMHNCWLYMHKFNPPEAHRKTSSISPILIHHVLLHVTDPSNPANGTSIIRIQQEPSMQRKEARASELPYMKSYRPYGSCIQSHPDPWRRTKEHTTMTRPLYHIWTTWYRAPNMTFFNFLRQLFLCFLDSLTWNQLKGILDLEVLVMDLCDCGER